VAGHQSSSPSMGSVVAVSAITSAVVSGGILLGVFAGGNLMDTEPRAVPDLAGMTAENAGSVLRSQRLSLIVDGEEHDPQIAAGHICRQEPRSGSQVPPDTAIHVWSSLGPEPTHVPSLAGLSLSDARSALSEAGLELGAVVEQPGEGAPGSVVRSTPAAGQAVERGATISLVTRPTVVEVQVPLVVGQSVRRARELIVAAGFVVGQERTRFDDMRGPFVVLAQEPEGETMAPQGSAVNLVVNEGD
jgi:beta-lactam-binding protein with PASTA domain